MTHLLNLLRRHFLFIGLKGDHLEPLPAIVSILVVSASHLAYCKHLARQTVAGVPGVMQMVNQIEVTAARPYIFAPTVRSWTPESACQMSKSLFARPLTPTLPASANS